MSLTNMGMSDACKHKILDTSSIAPQRLALREPATWLKWLNAAAFKTQLLVQQLLFDPLIADSCKAGQCGSNVLLPL